MNHPLFSVIVPHYTKGDTQLLQRAIASIPDDKEIQVLVVDNSPNPIESNLFEDRINVLILFSDNTKGAGHARNVGLEHAKGKWLLFLDADDFFLYDAFDIMSKHISSKSEIIFFKMTSKFSDTLEYATRHEVYEKKIDDYFLNKDEYMLRCEYPSPCGKMISSSFIQENNIKFDEVTAGNDVMFGLRIGLLAENIEVDKNYIYCVTVQKESLTNTMSMKNIESRFNVNIRKNAMLKKYGYKKSSSVLFYIISSARYGTKPFLKLFFKALYSGNLFVGYDRWINNLPNKIRKIQKQDTLLKVSST